jgi:hypothetical protein
LTLEAAGLTLVLQVGRLRDRNRVGGGWLAVAIACLLGLNACFRLGYDEDQQPMGAGDAGPDVVGDAGDDPADDGGMWAPTAGSGGNPAASGTGGSGGMEAGTDSDGGTAPDAGLEGGTPNWEIPWSHRKPLVIQAARLQPGVLDNFPVLVSLVSDANLVDNVRQPQGGDIRFTDDRGTPLDHEIELFDPATGRLVAWVRLPSLSSDADTKIYMYYGSSSAVDQQNVSGVWDSDFVTVHHLDSLEDSTESDYDLVAVGNPLIGYGGPLGNGALVDGDSDGEGDGFVIDVSRDGDRDELVDDDLQELDGISNMTMSAWVRMDSLRSFEGVLGKNGTQDNRGWGLSSGGPGGSGNSSIVMAMETVGGSGDTTSAGLIATGAFQHWVVVYTGSVADKLHVYIDGNEVSTTPFATSGSVLARTPDTDYPTRIATTPFEPSESVIGMIDEVRLSKTNRSATWIRAEYENQSDPSGFIVVDPEESRD